MGNPGNDIVIREQEGEWVTDPLEFHAEPGQQVTFCAEGTDAKLWFPSGTPFSQSLFTLEADEACTKTVVQSAAGAFPFEVYCLSPCKFDGHPRIIIG